MTARTARSLLAGTALAIVGAPRRWEGETLLVLTRQHSITVTDVLAVLLLLSWAGLAVTALTPRGAGPGTRAAVLRGAARARPDGLSGLVLGLGVVAVSLDLGNATRWLCLVGGVLFAVGAAALEAGAVAPATASAGGRR